MKIKQLFFVSALVFGSVISGAQETIIFEDDFEYGNFGSEWDVNPNLNGTYGLIDIFDGVGVNNSRGVLIGKTQDGSEFTTNALDLHLDLSGQSNVELTFWIGDHFDENQPDDGIYFSDNGGASFEKVLGLFPLEWCDGLLGQHPPIDVDELADLAGLNLTDQFVIRFQQTGISDFYDSFNWGDGFYLDDVIVYNPNLEYVTLPFEDDFNIGKLGNSWAWNFAEETSIVETDSEITSPMSLVEIINGHGVDQTPCVLMGRRCDGVFTTNALDLHLNLSGESDVELTFWIRDHFDENQLDDGIYFSDDGGASFEKVLGLFPGEWCEGVIGKHPPIDVDELADLAGLNLTDQFVIRFQQTGSSDFYDSFNWGDGFYLDDVKVYNPNLQYATLPFEDDFNIGKLGDSWAWNFAEETSIVETDSEITSPMSLVEIINGHGVNQTPCVWMGRRCDGVFTTNALDLYLDLSDETDVELTFWIKDHFDETQLDDGIYFSDDGGASFEKVLGLFPGEWCEGVMGQHPPIDVDELAEAVGLNLTEQFVIRFQQMGDSDFYDSFGWGDGFLLDDVKVYNPNLQYATLPFEDDFEAGTFKSSWAWNFADNSTSVALDNEITSPMNLVGIFPGVGYDGSSYAAAMGRRCDGLFTTNALDLHLNLAGQTDVGMSFWLADYYDEPQPDDGIYFSNDGGATFVKSVDFDFSSILDNTYHFYEFDISGLASGLGLSLTDKFVIRFQQTGESDFYDSFGYGDGYYLDNVNVTGIPTSLDHPEMHDIVKIYPNPASNYLTVDLRETTITDRVLEVYNMAGNKVLSKEINGSNFNLNIESLETGIYFVKIISEEISHVEKIIKHR